MGHTVNAREPTWGNLQTVHWDARTNTLSGGSDPRNPVGKAEVQLRDANAQMSEPTAEEAGAAQRARDPDRRGGVDRVADRACTSTCAAIANRRRQPLPVAPATPRVVAEAGTRARNAEARRSLRAAPSTASPSNTMARRAPPTGASPSKPTATHCSPSSRTSWTTPAAATSRCPKDAAGVLRLDGRPGARIVVKGWRGRLFGLGARAGCDRRGLPVGQRRDRRDPRGGGRTRRRRLRVPPRPPIAAR